MNWEEAEKLLAPLVVEADGLAARIRRAVSCSADGEERDVVCPRCNGSGERSGGYQNSCIVYCPTTIKHSGSCLSAHRIDADRLCRACAARWHAEHSAAALRAIVEAKRREEKEAERRLEEKKKDEAHAEERLAVLRGQVKDAERELTSLKDDDE